MIIKKELKHDNCKDCISRCEHAGKDREFVCPNGISCKNTCNSEMLIREMQNGKFIRISGNGYDPSVFWLSGFGDKINCFSIPIGGAFERPDLTIFELKKHFEIMQRENMTFEIIDITKAK